MSKSTNTGMSSRDKFRIYLGANRYAKGAECKPYDFTGREIIELLTQEPERSKLTAKKHLDLTRAYLAEADKKEKKRIKTERDKLKDGRFFLPVSTNPGQDPRASGVPFRTLITIDIDEGMTSATLGLLEASAKRLGVTIVAYPSYNNSPLAPRFRAVAFPSEPIDRLAYPRIARNFADALELDCKIDPVSFREVQIMYYGRVPKGAEWAPQVFGPKRIGRVDISAYDFAPDGDDGEPIADYVAMENKATAKAYPFGEFNRCVSLPDAMGLYATLGAYDLKQSGKKWAISCDGRKYGDYFPDDGMITWYKSDEPIIETPRGSMPLAEWITGKDGHTHQISTADLVLYLHFDNDFKAFLKHCENDVEGFEARARRIDASEEFDVYEGEPDEIEEPTAHKLKSMIANFPKCYDLEESESGKLKPIFKDSQFIRELSKRVPMLFNPGAGLRTLCVYDLDTGAWITDNAHASAYVDRILSGVLERQAGIKKAPYTYARLRKELEITAFDPALRYNPLQESDSHTAVFSNGTYANGELREHRAKDYRPNAFDFPIAEEYTLKDVRHTLEWLRLLLGENGELLEPNDPELICLLHVIGRLFVGDYEDKQKYAILNGEGENGKSSFINYLVRYLVGEGNLSAMPLSKLTGENARFNTIQLRYKRANISAEMGTRYVGESDTLKSLTGGDLQQGEYKGIDPVMFRTEAEIILATNALPVFRDTTHGLKRRGLPFSFGQRFTKQQVKDFEEGLTLGRVVAERSAFARLAIDLYEKARKERKLYPESDRMKAVRETWQYNNNDFEQFIGEACEKDPDAITSKQEAFQAFKRWAEGDSGGLGTKGALTTRYGSKRFHQEMANLGFKCDQERKLIKGSTNKTQVYKGFRLLDGMSVADEF